MEYTILGLARLSGVTTRTLRHYDKIGLLKPAEKNPAGYRIYGPFQVDSLQQILFYRELGFSLEEVRQIISQPNYDRIEALKEQHLKLLARREQLSELIATVERTIISAEGGEKMSDKEKFAGLKRKLVADNEAMYGQEARARWGDQAVERSNQRVVEMSEARLQENQRLAEAIMDKLYAAMKTGDAAGEAAQQAADLHRQWLMCFWDSYSKEAHRGLAQMYVDDERFTAFYDRERPGTAQFLRDAIFHYTE